MEINLCQVPCPRHHHPLCSFTKVFCSLRLCRRAIFYFSQELLLLLVVVLYKSEGGGVKDGCVCMNVLCWEVSQTVPNCVGSSYISGTEAVRERGMISKNKDERFIHRHYVRISILLVLS